MSKIKIPSTYGGWTEAEIDNSGNYKVQEKHDVSDIIDANKHERNHEDTEYLGKGTQTSGKKIGSISPVMMMQLIEQGIFWDDKKLLAWFDDLDNYLWRTTDKTRH